MLAPSLASVWDHIRGDQYRHYFGYFAPAAEHRALIERVVMPWLVVGGAALAAGFLRARDAGERTAYAALSAAAGLVVGFTFRYGVPDPQPYFLPALAFGAAATAPALAAIALPRARGAALRLGIVALAAGAIAVPWVREGVTGARDRLRESDYLVVGGPVRHGDRVLARRSPYRLRVPGLREKTPCRARPQPAARFRARLRVHFGIDPIDGHLSPRSHPGVPTRRRGSAGTSSR
jgi:hypothetical protein